MIVITGASGFIGSCMLSKLNREGEKDIIIVDDFTKIYKGNNYSNLIYKQKIDRKDFLSWFEINHSKVNEVYHIGARTDTAEFNWEVFRELNLDYSKKIWTICSQNNIPLIYASSAATYGDGELGYDDNHSIIPNLKPLNPYGKSKQDFDLWVLEQENTPEFWAGFKFFNVYGPNEFHKDRMASVIYHSFNQINDKGFVKLFRSDRKEYKDGYQLRDFIYVKDLVNVLFFMMKEKKESGIYNLGTGKARSFYDLACSTFKAMEREINIEFIDIPEDIREKYQYYTQANMTKLLSQGYTQGFTSLEEGVEDYVQNYLIKKNYY